MSLPVQLQKGEESLQIVKRHPMSLIGRLVLIGLVVIIVGVDVGSSWGFGGTGNFATVMNWTMGIVLVIGLAGHLLLSLPERPLDHHEPACDRLDQDYPFQPQRQDGRPGEPAGHQHRQARGLADDVRLWGRAVPDSLRRRPPVRSSTACVTLTRPRYW